MKALKKDIVLKVQDSFFESGFEKWEVFCQVKEERKYILSRGTRICK